MSDKLIAFFCDLTLSSPKERVLKRNFSSHSLELLCGPNLCLKPRRSYILVEKQV